MTTVLNTRPRQQAAELSHYLQAAGLTSIEAAAVEIVPAWDAVELTATRHSLHSGDFAWVVLPSVNAARAVLGDLGTTPIVCGASTAQNLKISATIGLERFSAGAVVEALRDRVTAGQRVLVPRAEHGRDELRAGLQALGLQVSAPTAYRTVATDTAARRLMRGGIDVVTACSPSTVASLLPAREALLQAQLVCLGETTASAARDAGLSVAAVATRTSMAALVRAIVGVTGPRVLA